MPHDLPVIVKMDGDLGVAFDAGYRIDGDAFHGHSLPKLHLEVAFGLASFQQSSRITSAMILDGEGSREGISLP